MKILKARKEIVGLKNDEDFQTAYFCGKKEAITKMEKLMDQAYPTPKKSSY